MTKPSSICSRSKAWWLAASLCWINLALLFFLALPSQAVTLLEEKFSASTGSPPSTAEAAHFNYWYTPEPSTWYWNGGEAYAFTNTSSSQVAPRWMMRKLTDGNVIATSDPMSTPLLKLDVSMTWGEDGNEVLAYLVGLFDEAGQGYIAKVTRGKTLSLHRIDNDAKEEAPAWSLIASNQSNTAGNAQTLTLSVNDGVVRLTSSQGGALEAKERTYTRFTTIGLAAITPGNEKFVVKNLNLQNNVEVSTLQLDATGEKSNLIVADTGRKQIRVQVQSKAPHKKVSLVAELRDFQGKSVVATGKTTVDTAIGSFVAEIPVLISKFGLYDLTIRATTPEGQPLASQITSFAAVPIRTAVGPDDFGVCTHFSQNKGSLPRSLELIKLAGFSRIRDDLSWEGIETKPGVYTFPKRYDDFINMAHRLGLSPLGLLAYGNSVAYPTEFSDSNGFPNTAAEYELFANYAKACVQRYGDKIKQWEVWNEPHSWGKATPEQYAELLKVVYPAIKLVRSDAYVISCGGGGPGGGPSGDYAGRVIQSGGLNAMDGFSIHPYISPPDNYDWGYEAVGSIIPRVSIPVVWPHLAKFTDTHRKADGSKLGVWVTELGSFSSPVQYPNNLSPEWMQAAQLTRVFLLARRFTTAKATFWYDFQDDGANPQSIEDNFGMIRKDYSPKASYVSMAVLSSTLGARPWTQSLIENDSVKVLQYGAGTDRVMAAWTVDTTGQNVSIPLANGTYTIRDWQGINTAVSVTTGALSLAIGPQPQYILPS